MIKYFEEIFYDDYNGASWKTTNGLARKITWSIESSNLILPSGDQVSASILSSKHINIIRNAFAIWDKEIDTISFVETNDGNKADITLATTSVDGKYGSRGRWAYNWDESKNILKATIQLDTLDLNEWFLHTAMHEIGNTLGFGDIRPELESKSVQSDPFSIEFTGNELWDFDKNLANTLYPNQPGPAIDTQDTSIGRLYTAAFGRVPDEGGLQYWINIVNDPLISYKDVSQNFLDSPEFSTIALPNSSSDVFATALYQNVLGRAPDSSGLTYWTNQLNAGLQDRADVLIGFANSAENVALYETLI